LLYGVTGHVAPFILNNYSTVLGVLLAAMDWIANHGKTLKKSKALKTPS